MKSLVYLRVSTKEQAEEGYSIGAQQEACTRYVRDKGWDLVDLYVDRGESARTTDRPQFQLMLKRIAEDRSIRYLVVHKLDRLARNIKDYATVREMLDKLGVQLVSVTEGLEATPSGKMVEGMLAVVAEWYSNNLSTEIRKGQVQKLREGGWPTHAPVGYKNVRLDLTTGQRRGRATIVPDAQAPLVRDAFELYARGMPLTALAEEMFSRGLRNSKGGRMTRSGLCDMLKNPAYVGTIPWKGAVHDGIHEPIIPIELFNQVQDVIASYGRSKERQRSHSHFLKGILRCGECDGRLLFTIVTGRNGEKFPYYVCASSYNGRKKCGEPWTPAAALEQQAEDVYRRFKIPEALEARLERLFERDVVDDERHRAQTTRFVARRLERLANDRDRLLELYLGGDIDRETFRVRKERIEQEVTDIEAKIGDQTQALQEGRKLVELALRAARNCYEGYIKANAETKKLWNQAFVEEIVVSDRQITNVTWAEPFRTLLTARRRVSDKRLLVDPVAKNSNRSADGL